MSKEWIEKIKTEKIFLAQIPEKDITNEIAEVAWRELHDEMAFKYFDYTTFKNENIDLCLDSMSKYYIEPFKYLPDNLKDEFVSLSAVSISGLALEFIPEDIKNNDYKICQTAVLNDPYSIKYVTNPDFIQRGLGIIAVSLNSEFLEFIPEKLRNDDICFNAISKSPIVAYNYLPEQFKEKLNSGEYKNIGRK